ncbi:hypothetical protein GCM10023116_17180 [Kistimonas scapharcae]|uniref:Hemerythrin-like domain-containing protein n=1 Tax=Kistimonas scapharcae TaxID=1036133 RepID=A0ABP8V1J8_9GAMM
MSTLVQEFLQEHAHITDTLLNVQRIGIHTEQGRKLLILAKEELLAHLAKEDANLYPVLWKAAETDEKLKTTLEKYAKDMDQISASALAFFEKYCSHGDEEGFEKDCKGLIRVLCKRIGNEEAVLYRKYNEIMR